MTQTAAVVGTAQYLSPEQARGETVDSRSDVYSTGCLLYELLTGRPPFVGESPVAVAYQHVREPAVPPSIHDPELPPEVDAIVMKALAKGLEDRYQSAAAMRSDIERYLAGRPVQAPAVAPAPEEATTVLGADGEAPSATHRADDGDRKRRTWLWVLLGLLLVALVAALAYLIPQLTEDPVEQTRVPQVVGQPREAAVQALEDVGLEAEVTEEASTSVQVGRVIRQDPAGNEDVDPGSTVQLVVSTGPPEVPVPNVEDMTRAQATEVLTNAQFKVRVENRESDEPRNLVIDQSPEANVLATEGTTVTIFVSDGPEEVPDVVGMTEEEASKAIRDAGFEVFVTRSTDTTEPQGTVIQQNPEAGATAEQGDTITIVVSNFVEPTPTPTPTQTPTPTPTPTETTTQIVPSPPGG
jgi:serine/threonine-protein kinase